MKRYTPDCSIHMSHEIAFMRETPDGGYMEYQDHAAVKNQRDNLAIRVTELEKKLAIPVRKPSFNGGEDVAECVFKWASAIRAAGYPIEGESND